MDIHTGAPLAPFPQINPKNHYKVLQIYQQKALNSAVVHQGFRSVLQYHGNHLCHDIPDCIEGKNGIFLFYRPGFAAARLFPVSEWDACPRSELRRRPVLDPLRPVENLFPCVGGKNLHGI